MHLDFQEQTLGVHQQVTLPTSNLLVGVVASVFAAAAGRLGRLGVGDARARERIPTQATAQQLAQGGVEPLEGAIDAPLLPEPVVDAFPRRSKSFRQ